MDNEAYVCICERRHRVSIVFCLVFSSLTFSSSVYAGCMIGNHGFQILLDGLVKNYSHIDVGKVYATMKLEVQYSYV